MALIVISLLRSNSVAFGAKRTSAESRLQNAVYEYASWFEGIAAVPGGAK